MEIAEVRHDDKPDGASEPDLVFVLGGDGTMLRATRMYPGRVLLGVNLGKVGFMSGMLPDEIESGSRRSSREGLEVQEYRMLEVRVDGEGAAPGGERGRALQEAAAPGHLGGRAGGRGRSSSPSGATAFIAATPLGSTAYALSAGGPIIAGDAGCYVLVPIAPHALVSRPLVLGVDQVAELELVGREALLSLDGEEPREIPAGGRVEIKAVPRKR